MYFMSINSAVSTKELRGLALYAEQKGNYEQLSFCGKELLSRQQIGREKVEDITLDIAHIGGLLIQNSFYAKTGKELLDGSVRMARKRGWKEDAIKMYHLENLPNYILPPKPRCKKFCESKTPSL